MYLIVGLGNPGIKYEQTRHNVGFDAIDLIAKKLCVNIDKVKFHGVYQQTRYNNEKLILLKPDTYMNASGESVVQFAKYFGIEPQNIIVLVDDVDIKFGSVKIKKNGSAGTHNGLKSIIKHISSQEFPRVKIAVGQRPEYMDLADFVLSKFSNDERKIIDKEIELAADAVFQIIDSGLESAMNKTNSQIIE